MVSLNVSPEKAIKLLKDRILAIEKIRKNPSGVDYGDALRWSQTNFTVIQEIYGVESNQLKILQKVELPRYSGNISADIQNEVNLHHAVLLSFIDDLRIIQNNPEFISPSIEKTPLVIQDSVKKFKADFPNPKKVAFIMMEFGDTQEFTDILISIRKTLAENGIIGLRADDRTYHDDVYYNILTYLHGCLFGIAVFERISNESFNPNVSLEVGYLLSLNKPICLLKEKSLKTLPSDLVGKLYREFDIKNCDVSIESVLKRWLDDKGL